MNLDTSSLDDVAQRALAYLNGQDPDIKTAVATLKTWLGDIRKGEPHDARATSSNVIQLEYPIRIFELPVTATSSSTEEMRRTQFGKIHGGWVFLRSEVIESPKTIIASGHRGMVVGE